MVSFKDIWVAESGFLRSKMVSLTALILIFWQQQKTQI